jgi:DinB superfamily
MADPVTEFEAYRQALLRMLGDDDPVGVLRATLDEVARLLDGVDAERLGQAPAVGEWSPYQVLSHLADSDLVAAVRVRLVLTQEQPTLVAYDQEVWAARFAAVNSLELWRTLRQTNVRLYELLSPDEWARVGLHTERGEESIRMIVEMQAGHDRMHLDQLRRGFKATQASARR